MKFTSIFFTASAEIFEVYLKYTTFLCNNVVLEEKYVARKIKIQTRGKKKKTFLYWLKKKVLILQTHRKI